MDWRRLIASAGLPFRLICLSWLLMPALAHAWSLPSKASTVGGGSAWSPLASSASNVAATHAARKLNEVSPYLDLVFCPMRTEPWSCARQQSARILDVWDGELSMQWQKLKVEADRQLNATIEKRGYSASELPIKEKPSTLLKKIEIGTNFMKEYLAETMDGFLGREYEYLQTPKTADEDGENSVEYDEETDAEAGNDNDNDDDDDDEEEDDAEPDSNEDENEDEASVSTEVEAEDELENEAEISVAANLTKNTSPGLSEDNTSTGVEFIEIEDGEDNAAGAVKKPGGGGKRKQKKKNKKNKKKGQQQQPATLVVVQAAAQPDPHHHHDVGHHESVSPPASHGGHGHSKPFKRKQKRGKRKKKGQHSNVAVEHESTDHLGLELLDDLTGVDEILGSGGKRKHKKPTKYGRSNGVTRGKKKKKKKALQKLILLGTFLKAKIELLLKLLGAHLQIKFFAIALIGLLINIARFWIDVKRGGTPSKVVYVEHAHHQHHYEDHGGGGGDDWSEQGSYWKRSLQTDPSVEDADSSTDSYQVRPQQQQAQDAHYLAYRNQQHQQQQQQWH